MSPLTTNPLLLFLTGSIGGSIIGRITSSPIKWYRKVKGYFSFAVRIEEGNFELYRNFAIFMQQNYPDRIKDADATIQDDNIVYHHRYLMTTIKWKGKRIIVEAYTESPAVGSNIGLNSVIHVYKLSGIRAKRAIMDLIDHVKDEYKELRIPGYVKVSTYRSNYSSAFVQANKLKPKPLNKLFYRGDIQYSLKDDILTFLSQEEWYKERGLPYKRSYLLYGPPGTGKTSLIASLAADLGYDLGLMDVKDVAVNSSALEGAIKALPNKYFLVLEDMDRAFDSAPPHIAGMLSSLDGLLSKDGVIIFATANDKSKIDDALLREGRMDVKVEIGLATKKEISAYFESFFGEKRNFPDIEAPISKVQEICIKNKDIPDNAYFYICMLKNEN